MRSGGLATLFGAEDAITCAELAHLRDGVLLYLLQFLLFLATELDAAPLHQNELSKELSLLQQKV